VAALRGRQIAVVQHSLVVSVDFILDTVVIVDSRCMSAAPGSERLCRAPTVDKEGDGIAIAGPSVVGTRAFASPPEPGSN